MTRRDDQLARIEITVNRIWKAIQQLQQQEATLVATAQEVLAKVAEETTVEESVIALLDEITAMLQQAKQDPTVLDQVIAQIEANKTAMGDAVARNTPAG